MQFPRLYTEELEEKVPQPHLLLSDVLLAPSTGQSSSEPRIELEERAAYTG